MALKTLALLPAVPDTLFEHSTMGPKNGEEDWLPEPRSSRGYRGNRMRRRVGAWGMAVVHKRWSRGGPRAITIGQNRTFDYYSGRPTAKVTDTLRIGPLTAGAGELQPLESCTLAAALSRPWAFRLPWGPSASRQLICPAPRDRRRNPPSTNCSGFRQRRESFAELHKGPLAHSHPRI
jgi:hypothetical protein